MFQVSLMLIFDKISLFKLGVVASICFRVCVAQGYVGVSYLTNWMGNLLCICRFGVLVMGVYWQSGRILMEKLMVIHVWPAVLWGKR